MSTLRYLSPPSPKELGRADSDALPSVEFNAPEGAYTWEDWHAEVKRDYPVRYFIGRTLYGWASRQFQRLRDAVWWVRHRTTNRFHIITLRGVDPTYRAGYLDPDTRIEYAVFGELKRFVEKNYEFSEAHLARLKEQHEARYAALIELKGAYDWWTKGRLVEQEQESQALHVWHDNRKGERAEELSLAYDTLHNELEAKTEEMLTRVIRLRRFMRF